MSLPIVDLAPLGLGVAWAIVCDLRRRRIPNAVSGLVLVIGIAVRTFHGSWPAGLSSLAASVLLLARCRAGHTYAFCVLGTVMRMAWSMWPAATSS
jgi:Flp pilus assembly protein protease CpaA